MQTPGEKTIGLNGLTDVETVTNALTVYIEYMTDKYGGSEPKMMQGPWFTNGPSICLTNEQEHILGDDITEEADKQLQLAGVFDSDTDTGRRVIRCRRFPDCKAYCFVADAMDAVRGTLKDAIELRQRIVKEWGYDPTHDG